MVDLDTRRELVAANRILGHEGILDAFGHDAQAQVTPRSPWSPEVARDQLGGFQRGARRAIPRSLPRRVA